MKTAVRAAFVLFCLVSAAFAKSGFPLVWDYEGACAAVLEEAKSGKVPLESVDFRDLREKCGRAKWFWGRDANAIDEFKAKMYEGSRAGNHELVKESALAVLELNYLDMRAHLYLSVAMTELGEDSTAAKWHRGFEIGLLRALARSGSGKSCEEGQVVLDVEEEYFVFRVMGWTPAGQTLVEEEGHRCDRMKYRDGKGETRTIYFDVDIPFENYARGAKPMPEGMLQLMQFPSTLNPEYYRHFAPMADGEIASMKISD